MTDVQAGGSTYVLIHGDIRGGWCYSRVAKILRAKGHEVHSPTLTGLGERAHLARWGVNCSTHVQDVLSLIRWEQLNDVILCGHSYGGMVMGAVADKIPRQVRALVYVDAIIPEDGVSVVDLLRDEDISRMIKTASEHGGELLPVPSAEIYNVNSADREMIDRLSLYTPQPIATLLERLKLSGAYMNVAKRTYVLATGWDNDLLKRCYERIRHDPGWSTIEVPCGHDVMLDEPERLAEILLQQGT